MRKSYTSLKRGDSTFGARQQAKATHRITVTTDDTEVYGFLLPSPPKVKHILLSQRSTKRPYKTVWVVLEFPLSRIKEIALMQL